MDYKSKEFELALTTLYINSDVEILATTSDKVSASSNSYLVVFHDSKIEIVALNLQGLVMFIYDGVTFRTQRTEYLSMIPYLYNNSIQFKLINRSAGNMESLVDRIRAVTLDFYNAGLRYKRFVKELYKSSESRKTYDYDID